MAVWQALFCLTLLSFLCRSFIPVGYMPDLSGERNSTFAITLCSMGNATMTMAVDFSGEAGNALPDDGYRGDDCPYGLSIVQKLAPEQNTLAVAGTLSFRPLVQVAHHQALPPLPALGPPLGSRAPPLNLV